MSKIFKVFLTIFITSGLVLFLNGLVYAQSNAIAKSSISISNFKANVVDGNTISGSFTLTNVSPNDLTDVYYYLI